ncbi:MAG TPA: uracil-DNA glycosylase [Candidatus Caenarcaniphilales bacterium]|nr:uracil-DNA glycosylase [Candidatus Caenarcaniphilales bacterium]
MTPDERRDALASVAAEVSSCTRCPLHSGRTRAVPGDGHPDTEVVFVGEGPGFNEDRQGLPFVGAAGGLLNEMLAAIGWRREEVFVTNVVKCRPPGNRDPEPSEIAACAPFLHRQLEVLDPALVVTLGRFSLQTFMPGARIGAVHGTHQPLDPATGATNALGYAMYHPAAALRQGGLRDTMLLDMAGVPDALVEARARRPQTISQESAAQTQAAPEQAAAKQTAAETTAAEQPFPAQRPLQDRAEPVAVAVEGDDADDQMELF